MNIGRKYERKNKKRGRLTVGSGNQWFDKGDLELKKFLVELKATKHKSYAINQATIEKIRYEAQQQDKYWAMLVELNGIEILITEGSWLEELDNTEL